MLFFVSKAQEADTLIGSYRWKQVIIMQEVDIEGGEAGSKVESLAGQSFLVIDTGENKKELIIRILNYNKNKETQKYNKYNSKTKYVKFIEVTGINEDRTELIGMEDKLIPINELNDTISETEQKYYTIPKTQKYFKIKTSALGQYAEKYNNLSGSIVLGVLNFPFKFRPYKKTDFTGSFNFGVAIGYIRPRSDYRKFTWSLISGYSISDIELSPVSVSKSQNTLDSINNFTALSLSYGIMTEYNKIQIGLFVGFDFLNRETQAHYGWEYQAKPWISVGFGYAIFSKSSKTEVTNTTQ